MFSKRRCLIVGLGFSHLGFWNGNFFLIAPFPDHSQLVPFYKEFNKINKLDELFERKYNNNFKLLK